jgi:ubiquinone/menaquinone biosynthesis C-methylase UbiE
MAPEILDVGCGPGAQTLVLARLSGGHVTALDNHARFLDDLRQRASKAGLESRTTTVLGSMTDLPFRDSSFDVVWSEGAIFVMGFEKGLRSWRRLLKPGGWIAVSEVAWLKENPPGELLDFWQTAYPDIKTVKANLAVIRDCGYDTRGHFVLPEESWWESYYRPLEAKVSALKEKYRGNAEAEEQLEEHLAEMALFRKYAAFYGYVFFVMKKTG